MTRLHIITDEKSVWFSDKDIISNSKCTRFCIEEVSEEMANALFYMGSLPESKVAVAELLYKVIEQKGQANN